MSAELLDVARAALAAGRGLPGQIEVYVEHSQTTSIKVYDREVESIVTGEPRGVGVRYVHEGRTGYAYTGGVSQAALAWVVAQAADNSRAAEVDEFAALAGAPAGYPAVEGLWRPALLTTSVEDKVRLALEAEARALAVGGIATVEESAYVDSASRVAIVSSTGVEAYEEQTFCYVYLQAHAQRGSETQTGMGFMTAREPAEVQAETAGREAAENAMRLLGAAPCPTGRYTVVLDREVASSVVAFVAQALTAEAVQKGRSLFAGRMGQQVGSSLLTVVDDGLHPEGMATSPFDGEGVPQQSTPLIERGVLRGFLHDTYTAAKEGGAARSTGNAARGSYRSSPGVSTSNLIVTPGEGDLEELFARVGSGLYVVSVTGLHSGANPVSGEFSVGATGLLIKDGVLASPVREVTIASDLLSLLANVNDCAGDARWIPFGGSVLTPSIAIADVAVAGV